MWRARRPSGTICRRKHPETLEAVKQALEGGERRRTPVWREILAVFAQRDIFKRYQYMDGSAVVADNRLYYIAKRLRKHLGKVSVVFDDEYFSDGSLRVK